MLAAALAAVWLMLFSRMLNFRSLKTRVETCQKPKPSSAAVIDMFMPQPIFRPR